MNEPCAGLTYLETPDGLPVLRLHYSADPKCTPGWAEKERKKYPSQAWWLMEMEMQADALSGQKVYPEFDPAIHVIPHAKIPKRLCRYMAIDPHPRTPHAMLWVGIDGFSDWYVYRELWPSVVYAQPRTLKDDQPENEFVTKEYAETIALLEGNKIEWKYAETDDEMGSYIKRTGGERIIERFMDQAGKGFKVSAEGQNPDFFSTRYDRFGIQCRDPYKSHKAGEDSVKDLLKPRRHEIHGGWPRLHISDECPELKLEMLKYRYQKTKSWNEERELKQEGIDNRCHLIDNLRYLATSQIGFISSLVS